MIELTATQQLCLDLETGPPVVLDPRTKETYILLPKSTFDRWQLLLADDLSVEEAFQAQIETAAAAGWDDPALDVYNDLDPRRKP